ncbi:MAG: hypothetical protein FWB86_13835 [Treponema sp.]|nr:hypothetical protein [Treponema sp.]
MRSFVNVGFRRFTLEVEVSTSGVKVFTLGLKRWTILLKILANSADITIDNGKKSGHNVLW